MKLKTVEVDGKQYAEVQDGKPVYVEDDGKEIAFDAVGTRAAITRLNGEAKQHRERAEKAEKIAKDFEGIEDPAAARKALETVANLDAKKLVDAGEIEKVKAEIGKAYDTKLTEATTRAEQLSSSSTPRRSAAASPARSSWPTAWLFRPTWCSPCSVST